MPNPNRRRRHTQLLGRKTLDDVKPESNQKCPCGSEKTFHECCESTFRKGVNPQTSVLLKAGKFSEALTACKAHLTWYVFCHKAHTVPALRSENPKSKDLLLMDIEALTGILELLQSCFRNANRIDEFPSVLDTMGSLIDDVRWSDSLSVLRSKWYRVDKLDKKGAIECFVGVDLNRCQDPFVLAEYLHNDAWELTFGKRVRFCDKICKITDDESQRLQFRTIRAISHLLICEMDEAIRFLKKAIFDYDAIPTNKRSAFGDHLYIHTLCLLGIVRQNDSDIEKAVTLFESILNNSSTLTLFGIGEYRLWLGRCLSFLGDFEEAIRNYELSLEANDTALAKIYLAEANASSGKLSRGREFLSSINCSTLSLDNLQDFAAAATVLALASRTQKDVEDAITALRTHQPKTCFFVQQKDRMMYLLHQTSPTESATVIQKIIRSISRYFILKPNFMGLGIDVGNVLEDLARGKKQDRT